MPLVFVLYALFASVFVIAKIGLAVTQPLFLVGSRMALAGILMLGYQYWRHPDSFRFERAHLLRLLQLAIFNIYLTNALEFWGLQYLTAFKTCFIYSLSPFLSALFSYIVFFEKMTPRKWIGIGIGFVGFLPVLLTHSTEEERVGHLSFLSWPEVAVIGAAICSMYGWVLLRKLVTDDGYSPTLANGMAMFIGGTMALVHSAFVEQWQPLPITDYWQYLECTILLIVVSNLICYNLYGYLLRRYTATFMSFAGWTTPLFAALFGWLILGEVVTWHFYISAAIVLLGLTSFYQEELRQGYIVRPRAVDSSS